MRTRRLVGAVLLGCALAAAGQHVQAADESAAAASVTRGPYLQSGAPDRVTIRWRTDLAASSVVLYGETPDSLVSSAGDARPVTEHEVTLTGLLPATTYHYALPSSPVIHPFTTAPPAGSRGPARIWVLGDSGTANAGARAVRDAFLGFAGRRLPDLWLMLGDNAYPDGTDAQYQAAVFDMYPALLDRAVLWPTLGNHDGHTADSVRQSGPYYDIFTLPRQGEAGGVPSGTEAYYAFDYGSIHFICLESYEIDRSPSGAMMTWLREDALSTTAEWVIAFWHHPPYSKGSHDSDREVELIQMRERALPILEEAGVDLVLAGHSHSYERSFLLDGHYGASGTLAPTMIRDAGNGREEGDGAYRKSGGSPRPHEGAVYVVAGSSGQTSGGPLDHPAMFLSLNTLGSLVLDVDGARLDGVFLDAAGTARDRFTLLKETPNTPPVARARVESPAECTSPQGAVVRLDATGSADPDPEDRIVLSEWFEDDGAALRPLGAGDTLDVTLPLGSHAITLRVTDGRGASATDTVTVAVRDTIPPVIRMAAEPAILWPPDGRFVPVRISWTAADACGEAVVILREVSAGDPAMTDADVVGAEPGTPDGELALRARREGISAGRVYTLLYAAMDAAGNEAIAPVEILVPHDRRADGR